MTDDVRQEHQDLLHKIEHNDRRFRMAQTIFMSIIGMVLVGLIAAQFIVIRNFQDQSAERARGLRALQQENTALGETNKRLNEQTNHYIQCIARFFATTDRQNRVLTDLDKCTYENNGQAVPGVDTEPTVADPAAEPEPVVINPNSPGLEPMDPEAPAQPEPPAEPDPVEVLGIPVCIPFTNVCVRQ